MALDRRYNHSIQSDSGNIDFFTIFSVCDLFVYSSNNHQKGRQRILCVEAYLIINSDSSTNDYHGHRFSCTICHFNNLIYIHDILVHFI